MGKIFKERKLSIKRKENKSFGMVHLISTIIAVVILGICLSGIYTISTGEEAVILRLGEYSHTVSSPGLKYRIPIIDKVYKQNINEIHRLEFGFETTKEGSPNNSPEYLSNLDQSLMLTGDENLVSVETIVQYQIKDLRDYFFKVDDPVGTLKIISESIIRRVVASHTLDEVLTDNKFAIQQEIKTDLQELSDEYELGILITAIQLQDVEPPTEVDAAFKDVSSAREDKNSYINEAKSYANEVIPKARGNAAEILNKAEAYRQERVEKAKGDVANFVQILEKYKDGETVTRTRMYLETLEEVLPGMEIYIIDENSNNVNILNLNEKPSKNSTNSGKEEQ